MHSRLFIRHASAALFTAALFLPLSIQAARAATPPAQPLKLPAVAPVVDCVALASADISQAVGSPTHITSAAVVNDGKTAAYCKVLGEVEQIKFEERLPVSTWTQRFVQAQCGGSRPNGTCAVALNGEFALTLTGDLGHNGDEVVFSSDYQRRVDFAYRGLHLTILASKALIAKYYGQGPKFSYYSGCSEPGREGMVEVQRFPEDFDGIIVGAPSMPFTTQNTFYHGWNALTNSGADGNPILTADKISILHKAVVAQCDAADGLKDGLVSDPLSCKPDVAAVECKPGQEASSCLAAEQVRVAQEIYKGAHDAQGGKLVLSGPLPGSELNWIFPFGQKDNVSKMTSTNTLKYLAYDPNPPQSYTLADLKFDRATFDATTKLHYLYDATDPDLKPFAQKGHKLILYNGLADPLISPLIPLAYYTAMQKVMGASAVDRFMRLYLLPGMGHCNGGEGPCSADFLAPIMAWVESGVAPGAIVASHFPETPRGAAPTPANAKADRTRPIYPYPYTAQYTGTGSIDDASNFIQGPARPVPPERLIWFGSGFFTPHYQKWCTGSGTTLTCKDSR